MERRDGIFIDDGWREASSLGTFTVINPQGGTLNAFYLPASAPFGGVKASGVGREDSPEGYDSFLEHISYNVSADLADGLADRYPDD